MKKFLAIYTGTPASMCREPLIKSHVAAHSVLRDGMQGARGSEWLIPFATSATQQTDRKTSAHAGCDKIARSLRCAPRHRSPGYDLRRTSCDHHNFVSNAAHGGLNQRFPGWDALPEQEKKSRQAKGIAAWHAWVEQNKSFIVDTGSPLGKTKNVSSSGIADIRNNMAAYTVVQAPSHEAAAKLFENHPHFTIFPGDGVEIMECLPVPNP